MKRSTLIISTLIVAVAICKSASAQKSEIVTDRPDQSNTPLLVPQGALQIEMGVLAERESASGFRQMNYTYNTTLLKYGINEHFEVRFNAGYLGTRKALSEEVTRKGLGPIALGMKIKLADAKGVWPQAALIGSINLPTGASEYSASHSASDLTIACAHGLTERWSLTYNGGVKWDGESPQTTFLYTLSFGYMATKKLNVFIEQYGFSTEGRPADHRIDGGITYKLTPTFQIDMSSGLGLSNNSPDYFISTGLSSRLFK
jgi:hypothetical protein